MSRPPPRPTRSDTLVPSTTLFRILARVVQEAGQGWGQPEAGRCASRTPFARYDKGNHTGSLGRSHSRGPLLSELSSRLRLRLRRERSEEHTSELQSLMRISYAVFCLKKKKHI